MSHPSPSRMGRRVHPARSRKIRVGAEMLEGRAVPAVFVVNSLADVLGPTAGIVTLRSAIQAANTTPGPNTIDLNVAGTYRVTTVGTNTDNTAGELAILGTTNLGIVNNSGGAVTVDGGGLNRVFDINPAGSTTPFTVTFQGFTVTGGSASPGDAADGSGGGIRAQAGASVVLNNMTLTGNSATADGGGISLESPGNNSTGTLTINASTIRNNHAGDAGGGVETDGTGLVAINPGTVITGNTCVNQGAGVWLDAGGASLNVDGALIANNTAITMLAGGIGNAGAGNVAITASVVANNSSGGTGGGFGDAVNTGSLTIIDSVFRGNVSAGNGGGIQEGGPSTTITDTVIEANLSQGNGGGLFVNGQGVNLADVRITGNVAVNGAGIEDAAATLNLTASTIDHNHTRPNNGGDGGNGGGIDASTGTPSINVTASLFLNNTAHNGTIAAGGGINQAVGSLRASNVQFSRDAADAGGAINFAGTTLTINNATFDNNRSLVGGGGIDFAGTGTIGGGTGSLLVNDFFVANNAGGSGGAILDNAAGDLTLIVDTINGNTAKVNGGGVALTGAGKLVVQDTLIALNTAVGAGNDASTGTGLTVTDQGGNLVGTLAGSTGFGVNTLAGAPTLGPLQNNGGLELGDSSGRQVIQTEALLPGSLGFGRGIVVGGVGADARGYSRTATPSIGAYEPQYSSNATANQVYVESIYEVILNRRADTAGGAALTNLLNGGVTPFVAVQILEGSLEYRDDEINSAYQQLLHRGADPGALTFGVNFLGSGGSLQAIKSSLAGSAEYYQLHGGTADTFIEALYQDGLARSPNSNDVGWYSQELSTGTPRSALAAQVFLSPEALTDLAMSAYTNNLGRDADGPGLAAAVSQLEAGLSDQAFEAFLLGSPESYAKRT